ncbi:hypothetical protein Tco_1058728 [Tanacetum coccineum]|uniref:Uncharacterized protein n=1 Tax=Tanacetum coccineum TaxID=301880 RepID=A0ABQ5HAF2_9ASTR
MKAFSTGFGPPEANKNAGTEDSIDAGDSKKEDESAQDYFTDEKPVDKEDQVFLDELERLKRQEKDANDAAEALRKEFAQETKNLLIQVGAAKASSTNIVNTVSTPVSTASPYDGLSLSDPTNPEQDDSEIPALEDIYQNPTDGIFTNSSYDDEGAVANFTNLASVVNVSPIPTSRIHSIHPSTLILGDPKSAVQTRSKVTKSSGAHAFHLKMKTWVGCYARRMLQFKIQIVGFSCRFALMGEGYWNKIRSMIGSLMYLTASSLILCLQSVLVQECPQLTWKPTQIVTMLEQILTGNLQQEVVNFLAGDLFLGMTKKQTIVATSIKRREDGGRQNNVAAVSCCGQVLWIQNQMLDYGFNFMNTKIYIDNESTICIVKNPVYHSKTKHIAIRHHFIRDAYEKKLIQVPVPWFGSSLGFRESLGRALDGTEALMLPKLFILWLATVSTDSAELVPMGKSWYRYRDVEEKLRQGYKGLIDNGFLER